MDKQDFACRLRSLLEQTIHAGLAPSDVAQITTDVLTDYKATVEQIVACAVESTMAALKAKNA